MRAGQTGFFNLRGQIYRVRKVAISEKIRESIEHIGRKVQHLADLPRSASAAIGMNGAGHCGPVRNVTAIHLLNHLLAPVAAGQIDVDVRPPLAALGEKAFKEHMELHRIHSRDSETETDRAVGGAAT